MRRAGLLAVAAALALALPTATSGAAGDPATTAARGGDDLTITFILRSKDGRATAIKRFRWQNLTTTCDGPVEVDVNGSIRKMRVNKRNRFRKTLTRPDGQVKVKGKVSGDLARVRGTIRAQGDFGGQTGCDSGKVRWRAA